MVRLERDQRREIVAGMSEAGMSVPAIASGLGIADRTVQRDLRQVVTPVTPSLVTGLDGKSTVDRDLGSVPDGTDLPDRVVSVDGIERPARRHEPAEMVVDGEVVDMEGAVSRDATKTSPRSRSPSGPTCCTWRTPRCNHHLGPAAQ